MSFYDSKNDIASSSVFLHLILFFREYDETYVDGERILLPDFRQMNVTERQKRWVSSTLENVRNCQLSNLTGRYTRCTTGTWMFVFILEDSVIFVTSLFQSQVESLTCIVFSPLTDFFCIQTPNTCQLSSLFHTFAEFRPIVNRVVARQSTYWSVANAQFSPDAKSNFHTIFF